MRGGTLGRAGAPGAVLPPAAPGIIGRGGNIAGRAAGAVLAGAGAVRAAPLDTEDTAALAGAGARGAVVAPLAIGVVVAAPPCGADRIAGALDAAAGAGDVGRASGAAAGAGDVGRAIGAAAGAFTRGVGAAEAPLATASRGAPRSLRGGTGSAGAAVAAGAADVADAADATGAAVRTGAAAICVCSAATREVALLSVGAPARTGAIAADADDPALPNEDATRPFGVAVALGSVGAPLSAKSSAMLDPPPTGITPPQIEQRARTAAAIFAGSTRNTDRHSGQLTFTSPPSR